MRSAICLSAVSRPIHFFRSSHSTIGYLSPLNVHGTGSRPINASISCDEVKSMVVFTFNTSFKCRQFLSQERGEIVMDRREKIISGIGKKELGLEIAPWFAPLAAKRDGYNIKTLDIFDRATLIDRAHLDPLISPHTYDRVEEVDFVGSATELSTLVPSELHGSFDYIISSHNFEHLPNPIKFLQGCQTLLKPDGVLSMAVPDGRACFDYYRPETRIGDWLEAWLEDRPKPTARQVFEGSASSAVATVNKRDSTAFWVGIEPAAVRIQGDIDDAFRAWRDSLGADSYTDAHCTVMTPASLELLLAECRHLGLITLEIESISAPEGCEFFVRLRNGNEKALFSHINHIRADLTKRIWMERTLACAPGLDGRPVSAGKKRYRKRNLRQKITDRIREWNFPRA
jgi:SAM-dependent methyltransferase